MLKIFLEPRNYVKFYSKKQKSRYTIQQLRITSV